MIGKGAGIGRGAGIGKGAGIKAVLLGLGWVASEVMRLERLSWLWRFVSHVTGLANVMFATAGERDLVDRVGFDVCTNHSLRPETLPHGCVHGNTGW
jgi:hypothetical protein